MADTKYKLNPDTLLYEEDKTSRRKRVAKSLLLFLASVVAFGFYLWLYTSVFKLDTPKTAFLKRENSDWTSKMEVMNSQLARYESTLEGLAMRDDDVYRNIFGMKKVAPEVRNSGFGGVNRYAYLDMLGDNSLLRSTSVRLDKLAKKTYVQSKSYDDIISVSKKAGDMASCIPSIPPILPDKSKYMISSGFGGRSDPLNQTASYHPAIDFACQPGNPVYATGDGVVDQVSYDLFGYGNCIVIDHGFGYKTRYAHLKSILVAEGMKVKRGELIAETGNTGRTTGPHLHYEVIYMGSPVNPANYYNLDMPKEEYAAMVKKVAEDSKNLKLRPHQRMKF